MSNYTLELIKTELEILGLNCLVEKSGEEGYPSTAPSRLLIFAGFDSKNRQRKITITEDAIETGSELSPNPEERNRRYVRMQLDAPFPFTVKDTAMADVAQFLHFLDLQIELPGFYLNHFENVVLYRSVHITNVEHVPLKIYVSILGVILFCLDTFGPSIERLASEEISFVDLLQELQKMLGEMGKKL
ncbi:MAG: hypothetical protein WCF65_04230 [Parachlamydiaceae bacterium]